MVSSPGKEFNYNGGLSVLLGEIIKRASGLNAEKFSEKHLFGPLGISHYRWLKYNDGSIDTGGGLLLRSRDMAKIGQIVLGNGKVEDKQIVSKQWIIESTKNHPVEKAHPLGSGYGYQWWIGEILIGSDKVKIVFAQGRGGQCIFVIPKANAIVVVTSQLRDNDGGFFRPQVMMTEFVIPALFHQSPVAKIINVDQSKLQEYLGDYEHRWFNITASVMIKDNKLIVASPGLERIEFFPTSQTVFRGIIENIGAAELSFSKNENGIGDDMTMRIGFTYILFDKIK